MFLVPISTTAFRQTKLVKSIELHLGLKAKLVDFQNKIIALPDQAVTQ